MPINLRKLKLATAYFLSVLGLFLAVGCGGGGGGTSVGSFNMFISDDLTTNYDHVWVTIYQIELQKPGGSFTTTYSSTDGVQVDLKTLNDGAPKFLFLGSGSVSASDYTGMRVTMGRNLTLVPTGSSTGDACVFDPALNFESAKARATFAFGSNVSLAGDDSLVLDFDLPNWTRSGNEVTPAFKRGDDSSLGNNDRQNSEDFHGIVRGLEGTAPTQTFALSRASGALNVTTTSTTIIFNENGSARPILANGQRVEVRGKFDVASRTLLAAVIKIEDGTDDDPHKVEGPTSEFDSVANTVMVDVREAEGFIPPQPMVKVSFNETTQFFTKAGAPLTLAEISVHLAANEAIEAEGTYTEGTNTLAAVKIKLHPEDGEDHSAEARGSVSNANVGLGTFDLTLTSWFGFSSSQGSVIHVATNGSTTFRNDNGDSITANDFFAAVSGGGFAEVEGTIEGDTFFASKVKIEDEGGGGAGQPEAKGYVTASNVVSGTITINLIEWFGFDGGFGQSQVIQTTGSTEFLNADGDAVTKEAFFAGLAIEDVVDAKGSYTAGVLTATRVRLRD